MNALSRPLPRESEEVGPFSPPVFVLGSQWLREHPQTPYRCQRQQPEKEQAPDQARKNHEQLEHSEQSQIAAGEQNRGRTGRQQHRPMCCSFCFGTYRKTAIEKKWPLPTKDDLGPWSTHSLAIVDHSTGQSIIQCEVLRGLQCSHCGATGDKAHTDSHCPFVTRIRKH